MAFDAGAIIARLDIDTAEASRKLDDFEKRMDRAARDRHVRLDATFDNASIGKARQIFTQLDNQLSRDAASRLRSSPQGSVLGSLNALFSPHQIAGSVSPQQAVSQGLLGQVARQSSKSLPGANTTTTGTTTANETVKEDVKRSFLGGLLGGIFGGGGGGGGATGVKGGTNLPGGILNGIGPNILGLGTKASLGLGIGGSLLGALPALIGPLAALGVGGAGIGVGAGILKSAISASGVGKFSSQYQAAQTALQTAQTPAQVQAAQQQMAAATAGAKAQGGAGFSVFQSLNQLSSTWQSFASGFLPSAAKILKSVAGLFSSLQPILQGFFGSAVKLLQPFIKAIGDIARMVLPALGAAFKLVAPFIRPLLDGLGSLVGNIIKGLLPALKAVGPIIKPFAQILGQLGKDVGALFTDLAPAFKQSMVILRALFGLVGSLLPVIAKLADIFARALAPAFSAFAKIIQTFEPTLILVGRVLGALAGAILKDLVAAFLALAHLLVDIGPSLQILAKALEQTFTILENSGVFATLGNVIESIVPSLAQLINLTAKQLAPVLPVLINAFAQFTLVLTELAAAGLTTIIKLVTWLFQKFPVLVPILATVAAAWWAVNVAMSANPIGLIIIAITALVGAATLLVTHWRQVWSFIQHLAADAWQFISSGWGKFLFTPLYLLIRTIQLVKDNWSTIWGDIKRIAQDFYNWIWHDFIQKIVNFFTQTLPDAGNLLKETLRLIWDDMKTDVLKLVATILDGFSHIPFIGHFFATARDAINTELGRIQADSAQARANIQADWDKLHGKKVSLIFGLDLPAGVSYPSRNIKGRGAKGVRGAAAGMWVVGEEGPEVAYLPQGTNVIPAGPSRKILGRLATGTNGWDIGDVINPPVGSFLSAYNQMFYAARTAIIDAVRGSFISAGGSGGIAGNVRSYASTILQVLRMLGQPASDLGVVERQMTTESGGQPDIVNKWDSNWLAGHPSVGLMQVIAGTFDAYAGPFRNTGPFLYGVSVNPLANIFAGLNYATHAYGPGWTGVLGQGHGYDSGGWLKPGWALNLTKGREAVLTPDQSSAHMTLAEFARQWLKRGGGAVDQSVMRDVYLQLPEGATVQKALSELDFKLRTMTQEVGVMTP